MDYKLSRKLMWIGIDSGLVLLAASMCFKNEKLVFGLMIASVAAVGLGMLQALAFYRCPGCKYSLMKSKGGIPENCPNCGMYLALENEEQPKENKTEQ